MGPLPFLRGVETWPRSWAWAEQVTALVVFGAGFGLCTLSFVPSIRKYLDHFGNEKDDFVSVLFFMCAAGGEAAGTFLVVVVVVIIIIIIIIIIVVVVQLVAIVWQYWRYDENATSTE